MSEAFDSHRADAAPRPGAEAPSREVLALAIENADVCVAVLTGAELRFTLVNPAYQAIGAGAPMVGRRFRDVFPEAAAAGAEQHLRRVLETGERWRMDRYFAPVPSDPDALWEGEAVRVAPGDGEAPSVVALVRNVTEHARVDRELRRTHEANERILNSIRDGLVVVDRDWRYTYVSETGARICSAAIFGSSSRRRATRSSGGRFGGRSKPGSTLASRTITPTRSTRGSSATATRPRTACRSTSAT